MFPDWPLLVRLPLQVALWTWVLVIPGIALTAFLVQGRKLRLTEAMGLSCGLGLVAVPAAGYLYVLVTGNHYLWWFPVAAATLANLAYVPYWKKGVRIELAKEPTPRLFWAGLAVVLLVGFFTYDPTLLHANVSEYVQHGRADCFRRGTFLFVGFRTEAFSFTEAPLSVGWDGVVRGNVMLSATYLHLFGTTGFRYCRIDAMLLLAVFGWLLGERMTGSRKGALIGLAALALNPYVVMIPDLDRNVIALAYAAMLFFLADTGWFGPIALGVLSGVVTGMGLNLMPILYLLPVSLHLRVVHRWNSQNLLMLWGVAVLVGAVWAAHLGVPPMVPSVEEQGTELADGPEAGPDGQGVRISKDKLDQFKDEGIALPEAYELAGKDDDEGIRDGGPKEGPPTSAEEMSGPFEQGQSGRFVHELLGIQIRADRPMSWPFHDRFTRGPDQPWPAFLFHLLDLGRTLGVLFLAIAALGFFLWWGRSKLLALEMLLWFLPTYLLLALQAVMIDIEQLRIIVSGLLPFLLLFTVGLAGLVEALRPRRLLATGIIAAVAALSCWGGSLVRVPVDERTEEYFQTPDWKELPEGFAYRENRTVEEYWEDFAIPMFVPNYFEVLHSTRYVRTPPVDNIRWWDYLEPDPSEIGGR